jgi:hypothetical protein
VRLEIDQERPPSACLSASLPLCLPALPVFSRWKHIHPYEDPGGWEMITVRSMAQDLLSKCMTLLIAMRRGHPALLSFEIFTPLAFRFFSSHWPRCSASRMPVADSFFCPSLLVTEHRSLLGIAAPLPITPYCPSPIAPFPIPHHPSPITHYYPLSHEDGLGELQRLCR